MTSSPIFFLGLVFLLFPLAHLRLIETWPIYLAEIPLLAVLIWSITSPTFYQGLGKFVSQWKWVVCGGTLFFLGALSPFFFQEIPLNSLGLLKSFIVLPLMLAVLIGVLGRSLGSQKSILFFWWLGILASALVGNFLLLSGTLTYDGRLTSLYGSPNHFAMLLSPGVLIGLFLYETTQSKKRWLFALGTLLILVALLATRSYASIGAVIITSLLLWLPLKENVPVSWKPIVLSGLLLVGGWLFLEDNTSKLQSIFDFEGRSSSTSRLMIWESAWKISQDNFPWGIGIGRFQTVYLDYQRYFPPYLEWAVPEPHNLFLSIFLSAGIFGLLGFLVVLGEIGKKLWRACFEEKSSFLARLYLSIIIWMLLVGLVDTPYFKNDLSFLFWGIIGLSLAFLAREEIESTTD